MTRLLLALLVLILGIPVLLLSITALLVQGLAFFLAGFARGMMQPSYLLRRIVRNLELTRPAAPLPQRERRQTTAKRRGCGGPPLCYDRNCQREDGHS